MEAERTERPTYRKPEVRTCEARFLVEALGPASAGSAQPPCGTMLGTYCE